MRMIRVLILGSALVFGPAALTGCGDTGGNSDSDGSDATDGNDGTDGTDSVDGTDGTDSVDGTDGTDGTNGTAGTDGTDATDDTDTTCMPFCAEAWECGDDSCGGTCGAGCGPNEKCNLVDHTCEEDIPVVLKQFGEPCGPTPNCQPTLANGADNPQYSACLNAQCETGICLAALGAGNVCGKNCNINTDQTDAAGTPGPDGVEDPGAASDCTGAVDGPYGSSFACVALLDPNQGQSLNTCLPGTTFAQCGATSDCPEGEGCQLQFILSTYSTRCTAAQKTAVGIGQSCNGDPAAGELVTCTSGLCFTAGFCSGFCSDDADCATYTLGCQEDGFCGDDGTTPCTTDVDCSSFECNPDTSLFADPQAPTFSVCLGKSCMTSADCAANSYCTIFTNGEANENLDWDFSCVPTPDGASPLGGPCGDGGPDCDGLCLNSGVCSGICHSDADCAGASTDMICGTTENPFDFDDDGVDDKILPLGLCFEAVGSKAECFTDADCANTGDNEVCNYFELTDPETGAIDAKGLCTEAAPGEADVGEQCGGTTGIRCKSGFCLSATETQPGYCSTLCQGKDTCPATFTYGQTTYKMACRGYLYSQATTLDVTNDDLWLPLCVAFGVDDSLNDCSEDFTCSANNEACIGLPWGFGATGPAGMDFMCGITDDAEGNPATGEFGDACDPTGEDTSVTCQGIYCQPDIAAGEGYCSELCSTDADCSAGGPQMVCYTRPIIERENPEESVGLPLCTKKASCIECLDDNDCADEYICVNVGGAGLNEDRRCAPPCTVDGDCASTDGGAECIESTDAQGNPEGKLSCMPTNCE